MPRAQALECQEAVEGWANVKIGERTHSGSPLRRVCAWQQPVRADLISIIGSVTEVAHDVFLGRDERYADGVEARKMRGDYGTGAKR